MTPITRLLTQGVSETIAIGRTLAGALQANDVVALVGALGAGKTHLTKGIATGLGVPDERLVNSPTFVLVNEYAGRLPVHHVDAYRLTHAAQLEAIGFDEMCTAGGVVIVEWADRVQPAMDASALWITLEIAGDEHRIITLSASAQSWRERLARIDLDPWAAKS